MQFSSDPVFIPAQDKPPLELLDAYTVLIDVQNCGQLLAKIGKDLPLTSIPHAKRVRKTQQQPGKAEILLCLKQQNVEQSSLEALLEEFNPYSIHTVQVSRYAAPSKEQQEVWSLHWPIHCHLPDRVQLLAMNPTKQDITTMKRYMSTAWQLLLDTDNGVNRDSNRCNNACVIVDPIKDRIIAQAVDGSMHHPLRHAVMSAVEGVAAWQRTIWPEAFVVVPTRNIISNDDNDEAAAAADINNSNNKDAGRKRRRVVDDDEIASSAIEEETKYNAVNIHPEEGERPYLCTGYDCYVVYEPCWMCAMALVHSRLRRVIFSRSDDKHGALGGSGRKLHAEKSINHHYTVYKLQPDDG